MEHRYNVNITWSADRKGIMCSPELNAAENFPGCIEVATPPEFPKGMVGIWSPEHLFTAAVSSCLMTTFLAVADNSKLDFVSFRCESVGKLNEVDGKLTMNEVVLEPVVVIRDQKDYDRAMKVLLKSESNCLISNSIKSKVVMKPTVKVQ